MEVFQTPLPCVVFTHDINDCDISMTNPMHGINIRCLFCPWLDCLFAQSVVILHKQEAEQAQCRNVSSCQRQWLVFCSGSPEMEGRTKCMGHLEKQVCKIPLLQVRTLYFVQTKLSFKHLVRSAVLRLDYQLTDCNKRVRPKVHPSDAKRCLAGVHYTRGNPLIEPRTWECWWASSPLICLTHLWTCLGWL